MIQSIKRFFSARAAVMLLFLVLATVSTWAKCDFFTDVVLVGGSKDEVDKLIESYTAEGWTLINKDLNAGAGGDWIYLLYKKASDLDVEEGNFITEFYIKSGASGVNETITINYMPFNLVPYKGGSHFCGQKGDLNSGTGESTDAIHLYYTKEIFDDHLAVTNAYFDANKAGSLGKNGDPNNGYDLNAGAGGDYIYMHAEYAEVLGLTGQGTEREPYLINNNDDWMTLAKRIQTGRDYGRNYLLTNDIIDITTPIGTREHPFTGVFDGGGKNLNLDINGSEMGTAPFQAVSNTIIRNLSTTGFVTSSAYHASGLIGICVNNDFISVTNCNVAASVTGTGYVGGIVGHGGAGKLTVYNSTYAASICGFSNCAGGIVGWCDGLDLTIQNCLFKGQFVPDGGQYNPIACKNGESTVNADICRAFYINETIPSTPAVLGNRAIIGAEGIPVSATKIEGSYEFEVVAADGDTYYAPNYLVNTPYIYYGFENGLEGWTIVDGYSHNAAVCTGVKTNTANTGSNSFMFEYCDHDQYLISPEITSYSPIKLRFFFKGMPDYAVGFMVGYSTSTNDINAFRWYDGQSLTTSNWGLARTDIPTNAKYIAIKYIGGTSWMYIDDISIDEPYPTPINLTITDGSDTGCTLNWEPATPFVQSYSYFLQRADTNEEIKKGTTTETSVTFTDLEPSTEYLFFVMAYYPGGNESDYIGGSFTTMRAMASLPYFQGFEDGMKGWEAVNCASGTGISSEVSHNGGYSFVFENADNYQYLISPLFDEGKTIRAKFYAKITDKDHPAAFVVGTSETFGKNIQTSNLITITQEGWGKAEMNLPEGARFFYLVWINADGASNKLYIDDLSFNEAVAVDFCKEGFATFFSGQNDFILPEGMKARIITSVDETGHPTYVTVADGYANTELEKMAEEGITTNRVPAGSAVMLQIDESDQPQTKYLILDTPTRSIVGQTNLLCGSDTATQTDGGDFFYRLTYNTSGVDVGWYWAANDGTAFTTNPHECWLALPAATGRNFSYVQIPTYEDPTGIETVKNEEWRMDNSVFDLSGRRISTDVNSTIQSTLKKGIYIINGKKTIIK